MEKVGGNGNSRVWEMEIPASADVSSGFVVLFIENFT